MSDLSPLYPSKANVGSDVAHVCFVPKAGKLWHSEQRPIRSIYRQWENSVRGIVADATAVSIREPTVK
jgi:hypothetical protein